MSIMAPYRNFHLDSNLRLHITPVPISVQKFACVRKGLFRRIAAAIERWQQRDTEQEAGRFIAEHGGRLTDDIERELTEHFNGRGFPPYGSSPSFRPL